MSRYLHDDIMGLYDMVLTNLKMTYVLLEHFMAEEEALLYDLEKYIVGIDKNLEEIKKLKRKSNE